MILLSCYHAIVLSGRNALNDDEPRIAICRDLSRVPELELTCGPQLYIANRDASPLQCRRDCHTVDNGRADAVTSSVINDTMQRQGIIRVQNYILSLAVHTLLVLIPTSTVHLACMKHSTLCWKSHFLGMHSAVPITMGL
jgi:hypothetical protein